MRFPEFSGEYESIRIGHVTEKVGSGVTPKGGESVYKKVGHPFVRSQNVGNGQMFLDDIVFIDEYTHNKQIASEIKNGDVLLNITGASIGRCCVASNEVVGGNVNQHVCIVRPKQEILSYYLCCLLLSDKGQKQIDSFQAGGNRQGLNFEQIKSFHFFLPRLPEQKKVAQLLTIIDERISIQNKVIEDLKQLKTILSEISYNQSNPNCRLGDCIEQISERNKRNEDYTVLSVSNRFGFIEQSEQFEDRSVASEDTSNYKIVHYNDFAFNPARINVGSIARLITLNAGIVSPMYICFRTKKGVSPEYLEPFFSTKYFSLEMDKRLEGSVRMCLSFDGLCSIRVPIPSLNSQVEIINRLASINNKLKNEEQIYNRLLLQKQFLLSQLFI